MIESIEELLSPRNETQCTTCIVSVKSIRQSQLSTFEIRKCAVTQSFCENFCENVACRKVSRTRNGPSVMRMQQRVCNIRFNLNWCCSKVFEFVSWSMVSVRAWGWSQFQGKPSLTQQAGMHSMKLCLFSNCIASSQITGRELSGHRFGQGRVKGIHLPQW